MRAQSLQNFEKTIAEALALGDIQEWDGRTLKQREEQIRAGSINSGRTVYCFTAAYLSAIKRSPRYSRYPNPGMATPD